MPIITYLGSTINEYILRALAILGAMEFYCPVCGEKMSRHGKYPRHIKDKNATIWIYRYKCKNKKCKKTVAVLPDFLMPFKQYSGNEIESVILDNIEKAPEDIDNTLASISTVRRWIREYKYKMQTWVSLLKGIFLDLTGRVISEIRLNCPYIEQLSIILRELPAIKTCGNVMGASLIYLSAYQYHKFT